jgi:putative SOS response-associated peptidase YedK
MCFSVKAIKDLEKLSKIHNKPINKEAFLSFNELKEEFPKEFISPTDQGQIFPNYFAAINRGEDILPMRYRIRPSGSENEVPSKFNVFNARLDTLEKRSTWRPLFGRNHGVIAIERFYEWVQREEGKTLVSFDSNDNEFILAPCLYDHYSNGNKSFYSFAIITDEPNKEVLDSGHDRQPIFLKKCNVESWLNPKGQSKEDLYKVLNDSEKTFYDCRIEQEAKKTNQLKLI